MDKFKGYDELIRSRKKLTDYDYLQKLSAMSSEDLERMVSDTKNYDKVFKTEIQMFLTFEHILKNEPQILEKRANLELWERYAKIKSIGFSTIGMLAKSDIGNSLFSQEKLEGYTTSKLFRIGTLPQLSEEQKLIVAKKGLARLTADSVSEEELEMVGDVITYLYGEMGPKHSRIQNLSHDELAQNQRDDFVNAIDHNDFVSDEPNKTSISSYFVNNKVVQHRILQNFGILASLSVEDRTRLFGLLEPSSIGDAEYQNITKLLYNGYLTHFPSWVFKDRNFLKNLIQETNIADFKKIINTVKVTNPEVGESIIKLKDIHLDKKLFKNGKVDKANFVITTYAGGDIDTYSELFAYRYFKTNLADVLLASKLIQDSLNTIPELNKRISPEGIKLVGLLSHIADKNHGGQGDPYALKRFRSISNAELFQSLKEIADEYEKTKGEIKLDAIMDHCRAEYGRNMGQLLTRKNSPGVTRKVVDGTEVYDLTDCDDFHLLIHSSNSKHIPEIKEGVDPLISMSLLDNNHLKTYLNEYIFGYDNVGEDSVVHAFTSPSSTGFDKNAQLMMYEKLTNFAPIYTDIETFMNATEDECYNEIKIKAHADSVNKSGNKIMKPSYLLFKSDDISVVPDKIVAVAKDLGADIFVLDTSKVKAKTYSPVLKKEEIAHGFFQC